MRVRRAQEYVDVTPSQMKFSHTDQFANSPVYSTWLGGSRLANNREELSKVAITRQEYQEYGSGWAGRRFAGTI